MLKTWRYNFDWRTGGGGRVLYLTEVWLAAIWSKKGWFFIGLSQHFLGCSFQAFGDNVSLKTFVREKQKQKLLGNKECFVCYYLISSYSRCVSVNSQSREISLQSCKFLSDFQIWLCCHRGNKFKVTNIGTKLQKCCDGLLCLKLCSCWAIHTCMISDT